MSFLRSSDEQDADPLVEVRDVDVAVVGVGQAAPRAPSCGAGRSTTSSSCLTVTSAPSGQTSTQMLQPLQASGLTVIESRPPAPFSCASGTSKNGAVLASGKSASDRVRRRRTRRPSGRAALGIGVQLRRPRSRTRRSATSAKVVNGVPRMMRARTRGPRCFTICRSRSSGWPLAAVRIAALEHLLDRVHEAGDRRVRALGPALAAARALLGDELRHLEAHVGHVADRCWSPPEWR